MSRPKKEENSLRSKLEKEKTSQIIKEEAVSKTPKASKTLTKADFERFFPNKLAKN